MDLVRVVQVLADEPREDNIVASEYLAGRGYARYVEGEGVKKNRVFGEEAKARAGEARAREVGMWGVCKKEIAEQEKQAVVGGITCQDMYVE
jgi:hypothetical protein